MDAEIEFVSDIEVDLNKAVDKAVDDEFIAQQFPTCQTDGIASAIEQICSDIQKVTPLLRTTSGEINRNYIFDVKNLIVKQVSELQATIEKLV